jgi:hypothetical protein
VSFRCLSTVNIKNALRVALHENEPRNWGSSRVLGLVLNVFTWRVERNLHDHTAGCGSGQMPHAVQRFSTLSRGSGMRDPR